jgi:6-pyruvoyltetrahydropterin/6-carboxytetrahydropterin synthase
MVEAAVSSKKLGKTGLLMDFKILKERLQNVLDEIDHINLNDLPKFKKTNPTSENIAKFIFDRLKKDGVPAQRVSVWESDSSCATYFGGRK